MIGWLRSRWASDRRCALRSLACRRYNHVILRGVKTAISVPNATFERADRAARKLGMSRSEFFSRAAEHWLDALDDDGTTEAINHALESIPPDHGFADAAAAGLAARDDWR